MPWEIKVPVCIKDIVFEAAESRERFQSQYGLRTKKKSRRGVVLRRRRVFLVDRHALMRSAAAGWINQCSNLEVCGMAGGAAQAFRAVERLRPDVVVSEIMRPRDLGFIRELHERHPRLPILVFSTQDGALYEARAREAGASRYLMKDAGGDKLVRNIRAVLRGRNPSPAARSASAIRRGSSAKG